MRNRLIQYLTAAAAVLLLLTSCAPTSAQPSYSNEANWAYLADDSGGQAVDVFFVCPTVYFGSDTSHNMSLSDRSTLDDFDGAVNMEKGIYDKNARFFAPYYRQAGLNVYEMAPDERESYLGIAYKDVADAFDYYLEQFNNGRPIILAGFSQGADMCLRLMKERFADEALQEQLIACYAIGWSLTKEEIDQYPHLRFAQSEDDTGVIVSFNSEAVDVHDSVIVPNGTKTLAINPLSWQTGTAKADRSLNDGACFPDTSGNISQEIDRFTGAYIDADRGTLKVTDVDETAYPPQLDIFESGVYHVYDYQFFYRDLQKNVQARIDAFRALNAAAA